MRGIIAAFIGLAIAFAALTEVRAGTLPNISGTWFANGNRSARCQITQSGDSVTLTNEQGRTATGRFLDPGTLRTDWGFTGGGRITGTISNDLRRITWSNGTFWSRPTAPPLPVVTPTPSPEPLRVNVHVKNNAMNPIYIYRASLTNGFQPFTYRQCISFRNVTTRAVTDIDLDFVVTNRHGGTEANFNWTNKGTFTPPVNIDNHCFGGRLWSAHVVRAMTNQTVVVTRVTFDDGTAWQPGMQFLRGFANNGEPLAQPTVQPATGSGSSETGTPPEDHAASLGLSLEDRPSGVYVRFVAPGSAADAAGVRQGDHIVSIGSNSVASINDVNTILGMTAAGTPIPMSLERNGQTLTVNVKPPASPGP